MLARFPIDRRPRRCVAWAIAVCAVAACGPSRTDITDGNTDTGTLDASRDSALDVRADVPPLDVVPDATDAVSDRPDAMCPSACASDEECRSACPAVLGGESVCCAFSVCTVMPMPNCMVTAADSGPPICPLHCTTNSDCAMCPAGDVCCTIGMCLPMIAGICGSEILDSGVDDGSVSDAPSIMDGGIAVDGG